MTSRSIFKLAILFALSFISFSALFLVLSKEQGVKKRSKVRSAVFEKFHECVYPRLLPLRGNEEETWNHFVNLTGECDDLDVYKALDIRGLENQEELKYVALPKKDTNITMVTLGIGADVDAEMKLKELYPKTAFYGLDPVREGNEVAYETQLGGTFFPIAISGSGGMRKTYVRTPAWTHVTTMHIGAAYFFGEMLREPRIDMMWVDTESHEYTLIEQLHRGGSLEKSGVLVCQLNVEMHKDQFGRSMAEKKQFHDFVWRLLDDAKFVMMKPYLVPNANYIRIFMINVDDEECVNLYFS